MKSNELKVDNKANSLCFKMNEKKERGKNSLFDLMEIYLNNNQMREWCEIVLTIIQLFQVLSFAINEKFQNIWKGNRLFRRLNIVLLYFKISPILKGNNYLYYIAYYSVILLILLVFISVVIQMISIAKGPINHLFFFKAIGWVLKIISSVLFIPIVELLYSMLVCCNGINLYEIQSNCYSGFYIFHLIIGGITLLYFICQTDVVLNLLYEIRPIRNVYSSKKTVQSDTTFFFAKCLLILTCPFNDYDKITQVIIALNTIILFYVSYMYTVMNPYYSFNIQKTYLILSYCSTWTFLILFIGSLLEKSFEGIFELCLIGNILIIIGLFSSTKQINLGLILKSSHTSGDELINQLDEIVAVIENQKDYRTARIALQGYVQSINEKTKDIDTPLKKYAEKEEDKNNLFYLIFHINNLYLYGITKYPTNICLRVSYSLFLLEKGRRRDQALIQLENTKRLNLDLCKEFTLYRLIKSMDQQTETIINNVNLVDLTESYSNLTYKKLFSRFKELINSAAHLYFDFWNLLLNPQHDNQKELVQLNNLGTRINTLVEAIHDDFNQIQKIKPSDYEMLIHYYYFTYDVLNDKDKAFQLKTRLNECGNESSAIFDESNLCHLDLSTLSAYDDYQFIIISAMDDNLGTITHISRSASTLLGYLLDELIGQSVEILIPEIFIPSYRKYLSNMITKYKRKFFNNYSAYQLFKLQFTKYHFYAKTKSRFIIPFHYQNAFFVNDNHHQYFYMKLIQDKNYSSINESQYIFYILTNQSLIIQNFSANAINFLGLCSNSINSSKDISKNIRELSEDFLKLLLEENENENKEKTKAFLKNKVELKLHVIKTKYSKPLAVTWTNPSPLFQLSRLQNIEEVNYSRQFQVAGASLSTKRAKVNDKNIMLHVDNISFLNDNQGLMFILEPIWHYNYRKKTGTNLPLQSLKEVITPYSRKSQKMLLSEIVDDANHQMKLNATAVDFVSDNKIDKSFLPEMNKRFRINPSTLSYIQTDKLKDNENNEDYIDQIKNQALEKKNSLLNKKISTVSSGLTHGSYDEYSDSSIGTSDINEESEELDSVKLAFKTKNSNANLKKDDQYYQIDMTNIKLLIYDFNKKAFIEQTQYLKISEMKNKLNEENNKIAKNNLYNSSTVSPFNDLKGSILENRTNVTKIIKGTLNTGNSVDKTKLIQEEILKNEITFALKKNNIQSIVYFFYILSVLSCLIVVGRTLGYLMQCLAFISNIDELTFLIYSAVRLQNNMIIGAYNIRELTLLNIPFYNGFSYDRDSYEVSLKLFLDQNVYIVNNQNKNNITTSKHKLPENEIDILNEKGGIYYIIDSKYNWQKNANTLSNSLDLINSALYHIIHKDRENAKATSQDFFSYSFNSLNGLFIGLDLQIDMFYKRYDNLQEELLRNILVVFFAIEIALGISFFILRLGLIRISQKNDSYLAIFYTISRKVIAESFYKCETFLYRFSCEFKTDKIEEATLNIPYIRDNSDNIIKDSNSSNGKEASNLQKTQTSIENYKHQFVGHFAQAHVGVLIVIAFIVGFDIFLLVKIISFENETYRAISIYRSENIIQKYVALTFTLLRELIFDENALFCFQQLNETIVSYFDYSLDTYQKEKRKADEHLKYLPQYYSDLFYRINQKSVCHYLGKDEDNCSYITDTTGSQGLDQLIIYILSSTRFLYYRNLNVKKGQKHYNFKYNLTVYGTSEYDKYLPEDSKLHPLYNTLGPMFLFNSEQDTKLKIIFSTILYSSFNELVNSISFGIDDNINWMRCCFIVSLVSSMTLVVILFIAVWFPFIRKMNTTIYKTKNMLSIIPIDVLASLANIYRLLEIDQNSNQTDKGILSNAK